VTTAPHRTAEADALFVPDGDRMVPTGWARGPWSQQSLHGGPVAALVVGDVESLAPDDGFQLSRLTLELIRPVPLAPLVVRSKAVRSGRRVQIVDSVVEADGVEVAWCRALRIRVATGGGAATHSVPEDRGPAPPEEGPPQPGDPSQLPAFHNGGVEMRFVEGRWDRVGPATVWIRLRYPVVLGTPVSPWQRVAAASDFGNGVSAELPFGTSLFINPDLSVSVHRPPVGEWVCLQARTRFGTPGIGSTESALWDRRGRIGRAIQNLVVEVAP
jgi:hypothetical protein